MPEMLRTAPVLIPLCDEVHMARKCLLADLCDAAGNHAGLPCLSIGVPKQFPLFLIKQQAVPDGKIGMILIHRDPPGNLADQPDPHGLIPSGLSGSSWNSSFVLPDISRSPQDSNASHVYSIIVGGVHVCKNYKPVLDFLLPLW